MAHNIPPAKNNKTTYYDHSSDLWFKQRYVAEEDQVSKVVKASCVTVLYLKRDGFRPSKMEHYGDGGAFPEVHYAQYPLDMGRRKDNVVVFVHKTLPVTVDEHGLVTFDAVVRQNENALRIVYSQFRDLVPKILKDEGEGEEMDIDEKKEIEEKTTLETKMALEKIVNVRLSVAQPNNVTTASSGAKYINYKPSQQSSAYNSGAKERRVMMVEMQVDPMEPPKFKHKRVPKGNGSPPVPVVHSPPRPVTVKDQQDWKIPPCTSNWKNPKGYTIPLDKRLAADGRGLQEVQINDNFAKLSEALYLSFEKAREAVAMRSKVQREMMLREKEKKELELKAIVQKARLERTGAAQQVAASMPSDKILLDVDGMRGDSECGKEWDALRETKEERKGRLEREKIREVQGRERKRERRLEAKDAAMGKKSKITRDRDRDISEKVALGMASAGEGRGGEIMYDTRLFNQEKGMDSGFATEDQYTVYDKGLFTAQNTLQTLCKPKRDVDSDTYGSADEQLDKIMKTDRFKPDKSFTGTSEKTGPRDRPVEFEQEPEDIFGLNQFSNEVKKGIKAMDKIGGSGTMHASAGSSMQAANEGGSGRNRIHFEKEKKKKKQ